MSYAHIDLGTRKKKFLKKNFEKKNSKFFTKKFGKKFRTKFPKIFIFLRVPDVITYLRARFGIQSIRNSMENRILVIRAHLGTRKRNKKILKKKFEKKIKKKHFEKIFLKKKFKIFYETI